jgi:chromosome segregation ATPase
MATARKQNQPSFNIFTGAPESPPPPTREPLRETFRSTFRASQPAAPHTVIPSDPINEDLRAQLNTVRYELETAKQDKEMLKLEHQQEIRDIQSRAEADFRKAQQAESSNNLTAKKYEALQRELSELQTRAANERQDLERRVRAAQEKAQQVQEEADELKEDMATTQREYEHKHKTLLAEQDTLRGSVDELRADLDTQVSALQTTQRKLSQREAEVGELEAEVLRLKANSGDANNVVVLEKQVFEQTELAKKAEALVRKQEEELRQFRKQRKAIEIVEEEKRDLQSKLRLMENLRQELSEARLRKQVLEEERHSWTSYLENEAETQGDIQFETPEGLARAYIQERMEKAELTNKLGEIKPELSVKEANIQALEDERAKLVSEIQQLKTSITAAPSADEVKARARLERQKVLATKEVEFLRAQVKAFDDEMGEMQPEVFQNAKLEQIEELQSLVDEYRKEVETVQREFRAVKEPLSVAAGQKRGFDAEDTDERVGELRRKNRQLQDEIAVLQKRIKVLESDYKAQHLQLKKLKESSRVRVLELKSNPTADTEALKLSTVRNLREANAELLARLEGASSSGDTVPKAALAVLQDQLEELEATVASRDKSIKRLKQIWTAKSLEFREAVASILGWRLDFMPNGRVRVTSMFYPGDPESGENSIIFDGENGTMKVSGGEQSAFANEIRDLITFWVEEKKEIPCFLAAMTLEFWERAAR